MTNWTIKKMPITGGIAIYANEELIAGGLDDANAHLITTAVNACIKLNPDNPMAVAESIAELYEACKELLRKNEYGSIRLPDLATRTLEKAISKVEVK